MQKESLHILRFKKWGLPIVMLLAHLQAQAQSPQLGGLAAQLQGRTLLLTPSTAYNDSIRGKSILQVVEFGYSDGAAAPERSTNADAGGRFGSTTIAPQPRKGWRWLAAWNVPTTQGAVNFFTYDGWLAIHKGVRTNQRLRSFDADVTQQISSNVYHMAFRRRKAVEDELFILVVAPTARRVTLVLPAALLGGTAPRAHTLDMAAGEARYLHVVNTPPEYTNLLWQAQPTLRDTTWLHQWRYKQGDVAGAATPALQDHDWAQVQLPHTWNAADIFDQRAVRDSVEYMQMYYRGVGWYRLRFDYNKAWQGRYVKAEFGAAGQVAQVWLNGRYLGRHTGGYTPFHFALPDSLLQSKDNLLAVRVDNSYDPEIPPRTADYNFLGGLYREACLVAQSQVFIKDLFWQTPVVNAREAQVHITAWVKSRSLRDTLVTLAINLIDPQGEIAQTRLLPLRIAPGQVDTQRIQLNINLPWLWAPDQPQHRYRIVGTLYAGQHPHAQPTPLDLPGPAIDEHTVPLGLRWYSFDADSGFSINGRRTKIQGVNVHQDYLMKGWAVDRQQKQRDFLLIKQMGANAVRLSHYPHHPYVLHLCDSLGLMVWAEVPVVNTVGKAAFAKHALKMLEEMIVRDRNHPSILLWGVGNEYYRAFFPDQDARAAYALTQQTTALAKRLDPHRPTVQAQNDLVRPDIMPLTDVQGRNRYQGWYEGSYNDFAPKLDEEHKKYPTWRYVISEYGAEGKQGYHVLQPQLFDHSETYQLDFHKTYWQAIRTRDYIAGGFIWNMFDFASFTKIGNAPRINAKGMMTYDRRPKDVYHYYQSQWSDKLMVHIRSHTQPHRTGVAGQPQAIEIFSNASSVQLVVNGKSAGTRQQHEGYTWQQVLQPGANTLKAIATRYGETVTDSWVVYFHPTPR